MYHLIASLYFIFLLTLNYGSCASIDTSYPENDSYKYQTINSLDITCPDEAVIDPCICTSIISDEQFIYDDQFFYEDRFFYDEQVLSDEPVLDLDCSNVTSEEQLQNIFQNISTVSHFRRIYMNGNEYIEVLRYGMFGDVSFNEIYMREGVLVEIEQGFLEGSQHTLQRLIFVDNFITKFPFEDIETFSELLYMNMYMNYINFTTSEVPSLKSSSLKELYLGHNLLGELPVDVFKGLAAIEKIEIGHSHLTNIQPGTFNNLTHLFSIHLDNNHLQHISEGTFSGGLTNLKNINFWQNNIETVEPGAIQVVAGQTLYLTFNNLAVFEEDVWRPNFEAGFDMMDIGRNPFVCGCDIAWLVREPSFIDQLETYESRCTNGGFIHDLNPDDFINC